MNFMKFDNKATLPIIALAFSMILATGCTPREVMKSKKESDLSQLNMLRKAYNHDMTEAAKDGYREGVRQGAEAAGMMRGGYVWRPYKVEPVRVPARIVNGIMIPSHEEEVIVRPTRVDRVFDSDQEKKKSR